MSETTNESGPTWFHRKHGGQVPRSDSAPAISEAISGLWRKCDGCAEFVRNEDLARTANVCDKCGHHHKIGGMERLDYIVDDGSFEELDTDLLSLDPLGFVDSKAYPVRIASAVKKTGRNSAYAYGPARIAERPVAIGTFLFSWMGGSMGSVVGEKVTRQLELALERKMPAVLINASGGARMQEGVLSLMQMARATAALGRLRDAGLPFISVLCHPTTGGVAASFAMLGDVHLAEPGALIGFAGPRVIQQTIGQTLPEAFQRSEFLKEHGMIDQIVDRRDLPQRIASILSLLMD